jgi:hypothetical protein
MKFLLLHRLQGSSPVKRQPPGDQQFGSTVDIEVKRGCRRLEPRLNKKVMQPFGSQASLDSFNEF